MSYTTDAASDPWIASDRADYSPGALVTLSGGGWIGDSEVKIVVEDTSGGAQAWRLEKVVPVSSDGLIELQFNLPEQYIPEYKAAATGQTTGRIAVASFTDSGGSYSLNFRAYDPLYYNFKLPSDYPIPPSGRASDPMPGANGSHKLVESLEPKNLALGQIVPFEVEITVNGSTVPEDGKISLVCLWSTITTNKDEFGFDPFYGLFAAFVDYGDPRNIDPEGDASATKLPSELDDDKNIKGTVKVSGLDNGDKIILEIWVVLKSQLPIKVGGNVQSALSSAETDMHDTISTGQQTIPLSKPEDFRTVKADVSIIKTDNPDPLYTGDTLAYTVTVTNKTADVVANGIVVTDILDPNVTFVSATGGGTLNGSLITWPAFALEPLAQKVFTVTVNVNPDAPTNICGGTAPDTGSATGTRFADADVSNIVQFTMITDDPDLSSNVWQEPTNVLPRVSVSAYKVWAGGPELDHQPVVLTLYRHIGSGIPEEVTGVTPTITPPSGPAGTFTYTWTGLNMYSPDFQPYIYTVDELTVPTGYTKTASENNTITNTYKPSLVILKVYGTGPLQGAVFELYTGDSNGPTGEHLDSKTTGSDGRAAFEHLADGTYWLVEAKPPLGYKPINNIGPFMVANGIIAGPAGFTPSPDGTTGNFYVTVQNQPVGQLPATGGIGTIPFAAGGIGLMMFSLSLKIRKKSNIG